MKNLIYFLAASLFFSLVMSSCKQSNDVATGSFIQKRKYTKGYHVTKLPKQREGVTIASSKPAIQPATARAYEPVRQEKIIEPSPNLVSYIDQPAPSPLLASSENVIMPVAPAVFYPANTVFKPAASFPSPVAPAGGDSQLVALLLCILIGGLGIHRFYLGYTGIGIIQLFTLGGCGIWALIDLIRIATGDLKPKGGEYSETL